MIGQTISHYKITEKLGEGGMGVVYKAEDTKLKRPVALKFLAAHLLKDEEARKRFGREATAAAGLSHPNICTVHEISEEGDRTFLAMEFIDGEGLDTKIERAPLPLKESLDFARQVADGLAAAHAKGVVHRDIKPGNLLVTSEGRVKILDFGLALLTEGSKLTKLDTTVGTVAYMSPEQAQGVEVDYRTDIWSLGCVLYEMVCGRRPFGGQYDPALVYEIVHQEPEPLTGLRTGVPMELEWIVGKCLAKDREDRYGRADEIVLDLRTLAEKLKSGRSTILRTRAPVATGTLAGHSVGAGTVAGPSPRSGDVQAASSSRPRESDVAPVPSHVVGAVWKRRLPWALLALTAVFALLVAFVHFRETPADKQLYRFTVALPEDAGLHTMSLSPDGRHLAIAVEQRGSTRRLWVHSLETGRQWEMPGSDEAQYPFWSPDGRYIGFFAQGKLKKIALAGGPPQSLCDAEDGRGGSWNLDGVIIFAPTPFGEILRVPEGGGEPVAITRRDESQEGISRRFPHSLPDGRHFLWSDRYVARTLSEVTGIYLGSLDGKEPRRLLPDESNALYSSGPDPERGFILFVREEALMAQPFDVDRLELSGDVFPLANDVARAANLGNYAFSVSGQGSLVYREGSAGGDTQLAWFDRQGKEIEKIGEPAEILQLALSPDEQSAALTILSRSAAPDIWLLEFARALRSRFTTHPGAELWSVWSPDGVYIAFASERGGPRGVWRKRADGGGEPEELASEIEGLTGNIRVSDWSRDGRFLALHGQSLRGDQDIFVMPLEGEREPFVYLATEFDEVGGRFSPDGRWMSFSSNKSGRLEVYVRRFPDADREWKVSTSGGSTAVWRRDGKELYYIAPDATLMAAPFQTGEELQVGAARPLFPTRISYSFGRSAYNKTYDVSADGQRFLIANSTEESATQPLTVVTNWMKALQR